MARPSDEQRDWLVRALERTGGKLPIFDRYGQQMLGKVVKACLEHGWISEWEAFGPWTVFKITNAGRATLDAHTASNILQNEPEGTVNTLVRASETRIIFPKDT